MPTNENPADFTTRGMRVSDMAKEKKWWRGPDFVQKEESDWPVNQIDTDKVSEATEINNCVTKLIVKHYHQKDKAYKAYV